MTRWHRLSSVMVRRRYRVIGVWALLAAVLLPAGHGMEGRLDVSARVPGSESARAAALIESHLPDAAAEYAVLAVSGVSPPDTGPGHAALLSLRDELVQLPAITRTFSYLDSPDSLFLTEAGTFLIVGLSADAKADRLMPLLRSLTRRAAAALSRDHPEIALRWTGAIALNYDLRAASAADAGAAERRVLPATLALLLLAFGTVVAALLPLLAGSLSIALALASAAVLAKFLPLSILLLNVVTMLGLGLGIDYALLVVGRFREALHGGASPLKAAREAGREAGRTILLSGTSVAVGFAALLFVPVNEIRSLAVGGLLVVAAAVLLATTLLPAVLAIIGSRVDALPVRRTRRAGSRGSERWRRWGRFVCAHPIPVLLIAGAPLVLLSLQSLRLSTDLPRADWLPREMESSRALAELTSMGRSGVVNSVRIVLHLPAGAAWDSPAGWRALRVLGDNLRDDPRVARVRSLPSVSGLTTPNLQLLAGIPAGVRGSLASADGRYALLDVMPTERSATAGAMELVRELRSRAPAKLTGLAGVALTVGGLPAFNVDYREAVGGRFRRVVLLVVGITTLALLIGFGSPLIAVKAVVLNLLSVATAFGAVVLVFQDGFGAGLVGLDAGLGGNFPAIPVIVFCVVFGLSMDYEVFLVARIAEARRKGMDDDAAIAEGLARTGGLITSAASVMVVVFAAFTLGDFVLMKILGFALAVAVFVDATVVRMAIGPALLRLAGRWNWWPQTSRDRNQLSMSDFSLTKSASSPLEATPSFVKMFDR